MARRGAFILMEGVDRAGKSSQAAALVKALNKAGHRAELRRFPGEWARAPRLAGFAARLGCLRGGGCGKEGLRRAWWAVAACRVYFARISRAPRSGIAPLRLAAGPRCGRSAYVCMGIIANDAL